MDQLKGKNWKVESRCIGHERGTDIVAIDEFETLHIEVKGAKGNVNSHVTTRTHFSAGQIKTHFGVAIVKALSIKVDNPNDRIAIAHPDDIDIRKAIGKLTPMLKNLGIEHYWVGTSGHSTD